MNSKCEGWQPIETAPLTGRKVIVGYHNGHNLWRTVMARYYNAGQLPVGEDWDTDEEFAPPGWYEVSETHEDARPTDHPPELWHELPPRPDAATPVPTPRAQMDEGKMRSALQWIADRYSDRKTTRECADDAYDMACLARSVIGTPVVPYETDSDKARTAGHAEEPGLDLSAFDGHTPGPWQMSGARSLSPVYKGHGVGPDGKDYVVTVPYTDRFHHECLANSRLIAAAPLLLAELRRLRDVRASPEESHKGEQA